jgi:hypothetical protein
MNLTIQQEHYTEAFIGELKPLVIRNWHESESYKPDIEVDPDWERYRIMDEKGVLICLSARMSGALVGYAVYFVMTSLHHKTILCGQGDALYVEPGTGRGSIGRNLIRTMLAMLTQRGVKRVGVHAPPGSMLADWYEALDFTRDEVILEKVL